MQSPRPDTESLMGSQIRRLLVPNIDHAIVANDGCEDLGKATKQSDLNKSAQVAGRMMHLMGPEDTLMTYTNNLGFLEYFRGLYGFTPRVLVPEVNGGGTLMHRALGDTQLTRHLAGNCDQVCAFIGHPSLVEFQQRIGAPNAWYSDEFLLGHGAGRLNDKRVFTAACQRLGIPTPKHVATVGVDDTIAVAVEMYEHGPVIIRQTRGAGGLGTAFLTPEKLGSEDAKAYLERTIGAYRAAGSSAEFLIAHILESTCSPATVSEVFGGGRRPELVTDSIQVMSDYKFLGTLIPSGLPPEVLAQITDYALRYAEYVEEEGGLGYHSMDWLVLPDGSVVAVESNFRYGGTILPFTIGQRLAPGKAIAGYDALYVRPETTLQDALDFARDHSSGNLLFDHDTQTGIVIVVPPTCGSMAILGFGNDTTHAQSLRDRMLEFGAN